MDRSEKCFKSNVPPDLCVKPIPLCQVQFLILKSWSCLLESVSRKGTRLQNTRIPFFLIPKIGCKCLFDANDKFCPRVCVHSRCLSQMSHSARGNKQYNVLVSERPRISNGTLFHFYSPLCRKYRWHLGRKPVYLFSWYCILFIIKGAIWDLLIGPLINFQVCCK